jgi:predicted phosphodiesterase
MADDNSSAPDSDSPPSRARVAAAYAGEDALPAVLPEKLSAEAAVAAVRAREEGWEAGADAADFEVVRVVAQSDTHAKLEVRINDGTGKWPVVPDGDVYIHSGDFSMTGARNDLTRFADWVRALPHAEKIIVAGNHDTTLDTVYYARSGAKRFHCKPIGAPAEEFSREARLAFCGRAEMGGSPEGSQDKLGYVYLEDNECVTVAGGLRVWGSPWSPEFNDWAFNKERGQDIASVWATIPVGTDVVVTHGPPQRFGGKLVPSGGDSGCEDLLRRIDQVRPACHIFGHVHEDYGLFRDDRRTAVPTVFANASSCTLRYQPSNPCIVLDIAIPRK